MASHRFCRLVSRSSRCPSLYKKPLAQISLMQKSLLQRALHPHFPAINLVSPQLMSTNTTKVPFECVNIQDSDDFVDKVEKSSLPVVVDFHASWCGPCKLLGPRLEAIIARKEGKVMLAKVDVDECADLAMQYSVQAVPTVMGFKKGELVDKFQGLHDDDKINSFVEKLLH